MRVEPQGSTISKYLCFLSGIIRDIADAAPFSSDYAAGRDENRCNVFKDGFKKTTGKSNEPPSLLLHVAYDETTFDLLQNSCWSNVASGGWESPG